jgi:hypothetical protein
MAITEAPGPAHFLQGIMSGNAGFARSLFLILIGCFVTLYV